MTMFFYLVKLDSVSSEKTSWDAEEIDISHPCKSNIRPQQPSVNYTQCKLHLDEKWQTGMQINHGDGCWKLKTNPIVDWKEWCYTS